MQKQSLNLQMMHGQEKEALIGQMEQVTKMNPNAEQEFARKMKELVAQNQQKEQEINNLKSTKQELLKVKGKPQKIIDKLTVQMEQDKDHIRKLQSELAKSKGQSNASM